jgi:S1-C subfamily serine protease
VNRLRDLVPELMNPAQVTKVNVPLRFTERRTLVPPATVTATVECEVDGRTVTVAKVNGVPATNIIETYVALLDAHTGDAVRVTTVDGTTHAVEARDVPLPDALVRAKERLGVTLQAVTPMLAEQYQLGTEDGLLVSEITRNGVADRAGVQPGDVIVTIGRYPVDTVERLGALLEQLPDRGRIRVGIVRGDRMGYAILEL